MAADDPGNSISWNIPVSAPQGLIIDHPGIWEKTGNFPITLFPVYNMGPVSPSTFHQQFMNSSKITRWGGPVQGHQIITKFCTCHDSTTVVACAILCNDHFDEIWMRVVIFYQTWTVSEPVSDCIKGTMAADVCMAWVYMQISGRNMQMSMMSPMIYLWCGMKTSGI